MRSSAPYIRIQRVTIHTPKGDPEQYKRPVAKLLHQDYPRLVEVTGFVPAPSADKNILVAWVRHPYREERKKGGAGKISVYHPIPAELELKVAPPDRVTGAKETYYLLIKEG